MALHVHNLAYVKGNDFKNWGIVLQVNFLRLFKGAVLGSQQN